MNIHKKINLRRAYSKYTRDPSGIKNGYRFGKGDSADKFPGKKENKDSKCKNKKSKDETC